MRSPLRARSCGDSFPLQHRAVGGTAAATTIRSLRLQEHRSDLNDLYHFGNFFAKAALVGQIALGRLGEPADIARAVAFLAGPAAAYITGETLHVNGGMYMP